MRLVLNQTLSVAQGWTYDATESTVLQTLGLYTMGVGLPFFFLSANAPLIQVWYARSGGPSSQDPYFLYGASNLGSLLALLAFPLLAEPLFGATQIGLGWAVGFIALGGLLFTSSIMVRPGTSAPVKPVSRHTDVQSRPTARRMLRWAALAFIPSSMMLVATTKIALDKGSIPLIWVVPLALYLMTFVLTFTNRPLLSNRALRLICVASMIWLTVVFSKVFFVHLDWLQAGLMIAAFFGLSLYAHRQLYEDRPEDAHLTLFYLIMSIGGALGGLFNSIIAPTLFTDFHEGVVTLVIAAVVLTMNQWAGSGKGADRSRALLRPVAVAGIVMATIAVVNLSRQHYDIMHKSRSFFGSHLVKDVGTLRTYSNGTTLHGGQRIADLDAARPEPLFYYHRLGPIGQLLTSARGVAAETVGVIGLGVGAMACHALPHQDWHFYEIDARVDQIARDPSLFTFLSSCTPDAPTHLGDARVVLAQQTDMAYDLLVIDAYSSDAVPVHLTTTEAMALYRDRLAPDGVMLYHISNRYYDIAIPLARSAAALGLEIRFQHYQKPAESETDDTATIAVMVARDSADFGDLAEDPRWTTLTSDGGRLWTDDYANLLSVMRNK